MVKRVGDLLSESYNEFKINLKTYLLIFILFAVIPALIFFFSYLPLYPDFKNIMLNPAPDLSQVLSIILSWKFLLIVIVGIIYALFNIFASVTLIYTSLYGKKKINLKDSINGGKKYFFKYFWYWIVYIIFLIGLFLLLVIPGIMFLVLWIFSSYILIGENKGIIDSLRGSYKLVKGRWWRTFGIIVLIGLIMLIILWLFSFIGLLINYIIDLPFGVNPFLDIGKTNNLPLGFDILNMFVSQLGNLIATLIITPFMVIFFKNFYLERKK